MNNYYLIKPGETTPTGPMTLEAIRAGVMQGTISMDYLCCPEGGAQWQPVGQVVGIAPPPAATVYAQPMPSYGAMPMQTMNPGMFKPANHMAISILVLILCCPLTGIYSVIKSAAVDNLWTEGRYMEAKSASDCALYGNIVGLILGFLIGIIYFFVIAANEL